MHSIFSVIIPTYNRELLIREALDSVEAQTYRPIEIIVVDDGSEDGTEAIVKQFGLSAVSGQPSADGHMVHDELNAEVDDRHWSIGNDDFVISYFCQENSGVSAARNRGFEASNGSYIQFLDSDDRLYPKRFEVLNEEFEKQGVDLVFSGHDVFSDEIKEILKSIPGHPERNQLELVLMGKLDVNPLMVTFSRPLLERNGKWDERMSNSEDRLFIERALCRAHRPIGIGDVLGGLRRGGLDHLSLGFNQEGRVICEESLARNAHPLENISMSAKRAHLSRMLRIALRLNKSGHPDLARRCVKAVAVSPVPLTNKQRAQLLLCKLGKSGANIYSKLNKKLI